MQTQHKMTKLGEFETWCLTNIGELAFVRSVHRNDACQKVFIDANNDCSAANAAMLDPAPSWKIGSRVVILEPWALLTASGEAGASVAYCSDQMVLRVRPRDEASPPRVAWPERQGHAEIRRHLNCHWLPAYDMPIWASRTTLKVVGMRQRRLHEISDAEAMVSGLKMHKIGRHFRWAATDKSLRLYHTPREAFAAYWDIMNPSCPWVTNPVTKTFSFSMERLNIYEALSAPYLRASA